MSNVMISGLPFLCQNGISEIIVFIHKKINRITLFIGLSAKMLKFVFGCVNTGYVRHKIFIIVFAVFSGLGVFGGIINIIGTLQSIAGCVAYILLSIAVNRYYREF